IEVVFIILEVVEVVVLIVILVFIIIEVVVEVILFVVVNEVVLFLVFIEVILIVIVARPALGAGGTGVVADPVGRREAGGTSAQLAQERSPHRVEGIGAIGEEHRRKIVLCLHSPVIWCRSVEAAHSADSPLPASPPAKFQGWHHSQHAPEPRLNYIRREPLSPRRRAYWNEAQRGRQENK